VTLGTSSTGILTKRYFISYMTNLWFSLILRLFRSSAKLIRDVLLVIKHKLLDLHSYKKIGHFDISIRPIVNNTKTPAYTVKRKDTSPMHFDACQTIPSHPGTFESVRGSRITLSIRALMPVEDVLRSCLNFGLINDTKSTIIMLGACAVNVLC
jgi:hypothetical protein